MADDLKPVTPKEMLDQAWAHLEQVVKYSLPFIKDELDRQHIVTAHALVETLRKAQGS